MSRTIGRITGYLIIGFLAVMIAAGCKDTSSKKAVILATSPAITLPATSPYAGMPVESTQVPAETMLNTMPDGFLEDLYTPIGYSYDITIPGVTDAQFGTDYAELKYTYDREKLAEYGLDEEFMVFYYNETLSAWQPVEQTMVDRATQTVTGYTSHFSEFVLTAIESKEDAAVAAPPACVAAEYPTGIGGSGGAQFTVINEGFRFYRDADFYIRFTAEVAENKTAFDELGLRHALAIAPCNGGGDCGTFAQHRSNPGDDYIVFDAHVPLDVYVAYDNNAHAGSANWLRDLGFVSDINGKTYRLTTTYLASPRFRLFRKSYDAGQTVHLPGNWKSGTDSDANYWVIVKPKDDFAPESAYRTCLAGAEHPLDVNSFMGIPGCDRAGAPQVSFRWQTPDDPRFSHVIIAKGEDRFPLVIDETTVPAGSVLSAQGYIDNTVSMNGTYYYTIFAVDVDGAKYIAETCRVVVGTDTDRDGVSDTYEALFGTDPALADSDGDGRMDGLELLQGEDPVLSDIENPVVSDFQVTNVTQFPGAVATFTMNGTDNVGITRWLVTLSDIRPLGTNTGWQAVKPTSYALPPVPAIYTLHAWAKDEAGNVSDAATVTLDYSDSGVPVLSEFTLTSSSPTEDRLITFTLEGSDDVAIAGWLITETADTPDPALPNWTVGKPGSYILSVPVGVKTVYAWAKDDCGNVSASRSQTLVLNDGDAPVITNFMIMSLLPTDEAQISLDIAGTDNVAVTGWLLRETSAKPAAGDAGWTAAAPATYTFAGLGTHQLYLWAKDAAGNVGGPATAFAEYSLAPPVITSFTAVGSPIVTAPSMVFNLAGKDNGRITGWKVTESSTPPLPGDAGWSLASVVSHTLSGYGVKTMYAWAKDNKGNVSAEFTPIEIEYIQQVEPPAGDWTIAEQADVTIFQTYGYTTVTNLIINGSTAINLDGLSALRLVRGNITITNNASLTDISGLQNLTSCTNLEITNNTSLTTMNFASLAYANNMTIQNNGSLQHLNGFQSLQTAGTLLVYTNGALLDINGFNGLTTAGSISVSTNAGLQSVGGFANVTSFGELYVYSNPNLTAITGFTLVTENITPAGVLGNVTLINNALLANIAGLANITKLDTLYVSNNAAIPNLQAFSNLDKVKTLKLGQQPHLTDLSEFAGLQNWGGSLTVWNNPNLVSLNGFPAFDGVKTGTLEIGYNANLEDISALESVDYWSNSTITIKENPKLPNPSVWELWTRPNLSYAASSSDITGNLNDGKPVITVFYLDNGGTSPLDIIQIEGLSVDCSLAALNEGSVIAWAITESSMPPTGGWVGTKPTSYTFTPGYGNRTIYAWAKTGTGEVSLPVKRTARVLSPDDMKPIVTIYKGEAEVLWPRGVTYRVKSATAKDWHGYSIPQANIVVTNPINVNVPGVYEIVYTATDSEGYVGTAKERVTVTEAYDTEAPVVTGFTYRGIKPGTSDTVQFTITATDDIAVYYVAVTESADKPSFLDGNVNWCKPPIAEAVFPTYGTKTFYGWAVDRAGHCSVPGTSIRVNLSAEKPWNGSYTIHDEADLLALSTYTRVTGDLIIDGTTLTNLDGLEMLDEVVGTLLIANNSSLTDIDGLGNLRSVGVLRMQNNDGLTYLRGLESLTDAYVVDIRGNDGLLGINLEGLASATDGLFIDSNASLRYVDGFANLATAGVIRISDNDTLEQVNGFGALTSLEEMKIFQNQQLTAINAFGNLTAVIGDLLISSNPVLGSLAGFANLTSVGGILTISSCSGLGSLAPFANLASVGSLYINDNRSLSDISSLTNLTAIAEDLFIYSNMNLTNLQGLQNLTGIGGDLVIDSNENLIDLADLGALAQLGGGLLKITNNDALPTNEATGLQAQLTGYTGTVEIHDNRDFVKPVISNFALTCANPSPIARITYDLAGTDNNGITGWCITDGPLPPETNSRLWSKTLPSVYVLPVIDTVYTLRAWAKDLYGNVSDPVTLSVEWRDMEKPVVTYFEMPGHDKPYLIGSPDLDIAVSGTDNNRISAWIITLTNATPDLADPAWSAIAPTSYRMRYSQGPQTIYVWARDPRGNISDPKELAFTFYRSWHMRDERLEFNGDDEDNSPETYRPSFDLQNDVPYVAWDENVHGVYQVRVSVLGTDGFWDLLPAGGAGLNVHAGGQAHNPSLVLYNSTPYVAWNESTGGGNEIYVKYWNGVAWEQLGGALNSFAGSDAIQPSMVFQGDSPVVAFCENWGSGYQLVVKKWNGLTWSLVGGGPLNANVEFAARRPFLACHNERLFVAWSEDYHFSGRTGWGFDKVWVTPTSFLTLTFPVDDVYYHAVVDTTFVYVKVFDGTSWLPMGSYLNNDYAEWVTSTHHHWGVIFKTTHVYQHSYAAGANPCLGFNGNTPYVFWQERPLYVNSRIYGKRWDGSQWVDAGYGAYYNVTGLGNAYTPSVYFEAGTPYLAFTENSDARYDRVFVRSWNGSGWALVGEHPIDYSRYPTAWAPTIKKNGEYLHTAWHEAGWAGPHVIMKAYQ